MVISASIKQSQGRVSGAVAKLVAATMYCDRPVFRIGGQAIWPPRRSNLYGTGLYRFEQCPFFQGEKRLLSEWLRGFLVGRNTADEKKTVVLDPGGISGFTLPTLDRRVHAPISLILKSQSRKLSSTITFPQVAEDETSFLRNIHLMPDSWRRVYLDVEPATLPPPGPARS